MAGTSGETDKKDYSGFFFGKLCNTEATAHAQRKSSRKGHF